MSAKSRAINCNHTCPNRGDIPLERSKNCIASSIFRRKKAITALDEELQQQVEHRNCSPARQLKVEPSTVIIHAQID